VGRGAGNGNIAFTNVLAPRESKQTTEKARKEYVKDLYMTAYNDLLVTA
jgi:hypothetical protein